MRRAADPAELERRVAEVEGELNDALSTMGLIPDWQLSRFVQAKLPDGWNWQDVSAVGVPHRQIVVTTIG